MPANQLHSEIGINHYRIHTSAEYRIHEWFAAFNSSEEWPYDLRPIIKAHESMG